MLEIISVETGAEAPDEIYSALSDLVSQERRERAARFRNRQGAVNMLAGEALARHMVCARAGLKNEQLVIAPDQHGKPQIVGVPGLHFNVSHSGDLVVCALSDDPIGADIELIRTANLRIAERFFRDDEYKYLISYTDSLDAAFFRIWTMKESYIKQLGKGLGIALDSFSVFEIERQGRHVFHTVDVRPDACCRICADDSERVSSHRHYKLCDLFDLL